MVTDKNKFTVPIIQSKLLIMQRNRKIKPKIIIDNNQEMIHTDTQKN